MKEAGQAKSPEEMGIEQMYKIYDKLNAAPDKTALEPDFRELLSAVNRSDKEKRLASQFITRFFDGFPQMQEEAINALLDLCEEDDSSIRKQVIRDLVTVCKKVKTFVPKIADVFGQLMQSTDATELTLLQGSLTSLFHIDAQAAIVGVFSQIGSGDQGIREKLIKFLALKFNDLSPEIINLELEKALLFELKLVAQDLAEDDFTSLANLLGNTKYAQTGAGQQAFVDMITEQMDLEKDFDGTEPANYNKLLLLSKYALRCVSSTINSQVTAIPFVKYYCFKVLPNLDDRFMIEDSDNLYLSTLMYMADFASEVKEIDKETARKFLDVVYPKLIEVLPLPSEDDKESETIPKFEYSVIECFLFMVHKFGGHVPEFLLEDEERLKDLRARLQYLARGTQSYMKKLREDLASAKQDPKKKNEDLKISEDVKIKISGLKMTALLTAVIREIFHTPPLYKTKVNLSWRPLEKTREKRKAIEAQKAAKAPRISTGGGGGGGGGGIYQPPSGKFSNRTENYSEPTSSSYRPRGGSRGSGGFRPYSRGRSSYNRRF